MNLVDVKVIDQQEGENWMLYNGDSVETMPGFPDKSIDFSVYSPPFEALYQYSATERDLGNCKNSAAFFEHFGFIIRELIRMTKPGRLTAVHVQDVPAMLNRDGWIGMKDFSGKTVTAFEQDGWTYHGRVTIDRNPQADAVRMHPKGLSFSQLRKDASWMRPAVATTILLFRSPGENQVPIIPDVDNDTWITWAHPVWYGVKETATLNVAEARGSEDDKHICALSLEIIERCIRLWSNPGDTVFSPFAGIGSEGYEAVRLGRRFVGVELKPIYFQVAVRNLMRAEEQSTKQLGLPLD